MKNERIYNLPNFLSLYRLLSFPFVMYLAVRGNERLFAIFLIINLLTDALDGIIARMFRLQTELGARLDALADVGMYISAITGVFVFKANDFLVFPHFLQHPRNYLIINSTFVILGVARFILCLSER